MRTIWKYELAITDRQRILMPHSAIILTVQVQNTKVCLWAELETEEINPFTNEKEELQVRLIETIGTGNPIPPLKLEERERIYIGTYQAGYFVGHVYEIKI